MPPPPLPPKPALSEHSTSNPTSSTSSRSHFHSPLTTYTVPKQPLPQTCRAQNDEEEYEEDDDTEIGSESEANTTVNPAQPSELMQLEMPDEIRIGSPEDISNNLDSEFITSMTQHVPPPSHHHGRIDSLKAAGSTHRWPVLKQHSPNSFQPPTLVFLCEQITSCRCPSTGRANSGRHRLLSNSLHHSPSPNLTTVILPQLFPEFCLLQMELKLESHEAIP